MVTTVLIHQDISISNMLTHVIMEVDRGHVLGGPAQDLTDFTKVTKVLLQDVLPVELRWHVLAQKDVAVAGRRAGAQGGFGFSIWLQATFYIWEKRVRCRNQSHLTWKQRSVSLSFHFSRSVVTGGCWRGLT